MEEIDDEQEIDQGPDFNMEDEEVNEIDACADSQYTSNIHAVVATIEGAYSEESSDPDRDFSRKFGKACWLICQLTIWKNYPYY